jgi:site-specific DNA recombinase
MLWKKPANGRRYNLQNQPTNALTSITGATRGGIPFGRGSLYYLLSNHFYIGEVKYKNEILPGEQPPILDRTLFEAVREKAHAQWSHRTLVRGQSNYLLTGLLYDDAGHRMVQTHATKAGVHYRYYASAPVVHGDAKTASAGFVSRVPATDVEDAVLNSLKAHLAEQQNGRTDNPTRVDDREAIAQLVDTITVHKDKLVVRLKSDAPDDLLDNRGGQTISVPWQKPPLKRRRQILLPSNKSRSEVRPQHFERRAQLVSAIVRGRQWLDEVVSGRVTTVAELCAREKCSVRQVNMTISLAFLAPNRAKAAIEGRLPRGIGIERLRDLPSEWSRQFEVLGLNPE